MSTLLSFDKIVGKIAGAIYSDINDKFPQPPLVLVPALTFKIRKMLESITDIQLLTEEQKIQLADDIEMAIIPMLFTYEVDVAVIDEVRPLIKAAAYKALMEEHK